MKNTAAIVLAAGKGTRMKSSLPKVLHRVCGRPMIEYPMEALKKAGVKRSVVVVGFGKDAVEGAMKNSGAAFALQAPQLGTGHAVMCALKKLDGFKGSIVVLSGDVPLLTGSTVKALLKLHLRGKNAVSLVSAFVDDPSGYGRVVRGKDNELLRIVEDKDIVRPSDRLISEINAGIYVFDSGFLRANLKKIRTNNKQGEYYLPELVSLAHKAGLSVGCLTHADSTEVMGVNNRVELAVANAVKRAFVVERLMIEGVTFIDPSTAYADSGVRIGRDTVVHPNVQLLGSTRIGSGCIIEEGVRIKDASIGDGAVIKAFSIIESSRAGKGVVIGPFARIRPESIISDNAHIGNFVEIKKSSIGKGTKINHLSYVGDSSVGKNVNIGAGTITCNYDGIKKHRTVIKDNVFVGSDSQLVAPVTIGRSAYIGSGSTITKDVPAGSLTLTRAETRVVEGWVKRKGLLKK